MTINAIRYFAWVGVIGIVVAGCAEAPPKTSASPILQARQQLNAEFRGCVQRYGYDPARAADVAQNALAPNELQWRQCIYEALGPYTRANPAMTSMYESLIASDIAMTSAIQRGTMTRTQRKTQIEQLVAQIKAAEDKMIMATEVEQRQQTQEFNNTISAIRALGN